MNNSLKPDIAVSQDLSEGALSYTTSIGRRFKLERILFSASEPITETITITLDSGKGSDYDTLLRSKTLSNERYYVYETEGENNYYAGDELKIQCTNANLTGVLNVIIKLSEVLL